MYIKPDAIKIFCARIIWFLPLLLVWCCFNGTPHNTKATISLSVVIFIVCIICAKLDILPKSIKLRPAFLFYFLWLIEEIYKSAFAVIKIIVRPKLNLNPSLEWIELKQNDILAKVIYANSITLTPGTITVDMKDNMILVHGLDKSSIKDLKKGEMADRVNKVVC